MADPVIPPAPDARTRLAETLWNDPQTRPLMERAMVEKFGDKARDAIPMYREREGIAAELAALRQEREQEKAERIKEQSTQALERERRKIIEDPELRVRPEEIPAIEKLMNDRLIGDHRTAAEFHRASQQVAAPRGGVSFAAEIPGLNGAGGDDFKDIIADPDGWARRRTVEIMNDFSAGRGDKWA